MNKNYGLSGALAGQFPTDLHEMFEQGGFLIEIRDGRLDVGYDAPEQEADARRLVQLYLDAYNFRHGYKIAIDLNRTWSATGDAGVAVHTIAIRQSASLSDRIQVLVTNADGSTELHDSAALNNVSKMVKLAIKDQVLQTAIHYYSDEVVGNDKPLYGLYKSLEVIIKHLGHDGRETLGKLAGRPKRYVDDVMETTQAARHTGLEHKRFLSDSDCQERARELIEAYARSLQ